MPGSDAGKLPQARSQVRREGDQPVGKKTVLSKEALLRNAANIRPPVFDSADARVAALEEKQLDRIAGRALEMRFEAEEAGARLCLCDGASRRYDGNPPPLPAALPPQFRALDGRGAQQKIIERVPAQAPRRLGQTEPVMMFQEIHFGMRHPRGPKRPGTTHDAELLEQDCDLRGKKFTAELVPRERRLLKNSRLGAGTSHSQP